MFEAWDNDAWKDDSPADSEGLNRIRINQQELWEAPPTQAFMRDARGSVAWASLDFVCFRLIPFYIEPGMSSLKVHFTAASTNKNGNEGGWLRVCEGVVPTVTSARAQEQYINNSLADEFTLEIPLANTETARFTFIQIWFKSETYSNDRYFPDGGISIPSSPGNYLHDTNQNAIGYHDNPFQGQAIFFVNADGGVIRQYDLMGYVDQGSPGSPDYAFQVHPEYRKPEFRNIYNEDTYPATWYTANIGNVVVYGISLQPVFDVTYLNTASPDILKEGSPTRSSFAQLLLAGDDQIVRRRRFAGCLPPRLEGNGWFATPATEVLYEYPMCAYNGYEAIPEKPYTGLIPLNQHIAHNSVSLVLLLSAFDYVNPANNRSSSPGKVFVEVKLELVEYEAGSGDPTVISTETYIEQVPYFSGTPDSWWQYGKRWQYASWRGGMTASDVARILDPNSFKLGTFRLEGIPFQNSNLSDQRLPYCLRVTLTPSTSGLIEGSSSGARDYFLFNVLAPASAVFLEYA